MNFRKKKFFFRDIRRPVIIAEISGNHNGRKSSLLDHIKSAAKAGADMIKIQTYEPKDITLRNKNKNFKINDGIWKGKYLWDLYKKAHTSKDTLNKSFKLAKKLKLNFCSLDFMTNEKDWFLEINTNPFFSEFNKLTVGNKLAKTIHEELNK